MWNIRLFIKKQITKPEKCNILKCSSVMVFGVHHSNVSLLFVLKQYLFFSKKVCKQSFTLQRSKFASAVGKFRGFCRGVSPFYSICLGNKNAEAVKFLEIKKNSFPNKKNLFYTRHKLFMCIYIHYSNLHFVYSVLGKVPPGKMPPFRA